MNTTEKFNALLELLKTNDFAYVASLWGSFSDGEKSIFKLEYISKLHENEVVSIYEAFCYINKTLANEILGYYYNNIKKKKPKEQKSNFPQEVYSNEGKSPESWESYIDFKVKYLQAFKAKLQAGGFHPDLIGLLIAQELAHLNDLSLGERADEQT